MKYFWVVKNKYGEYVHENLEKYTTDIYKASLNFTKAQARYDKTEIGEKIAKIKVTLEEVK